MKKQVYKKVTGPVILYDLETLTQRRRQEEMLGVVKIKIVELLFSSYKGHMGSKLSTGTSEEQQMLDALR